VITARVYRAGDSVEVDSARISRELGANAGLLWVEVVDPTDDDLHCLQTEFALHPLAIEDVRHRFQRPKLEVYRDHTFMVVYTSQLQEVNIFVGPHWVITVRELDDDGNCWDIEPARRRFERVRPASSSPGFLVYILLDELVDGHLDTADAVEEQLERLENRIFSEQPPEERAIQQDLYDVRRELLRFRRAVVPLREVLNRMLRREVDWVDDATATHLQDVFDHVLRAIDLIDSQRELMGNAVDAHLAIISNRMNSVMKKMTSWGAILLGSTLVAGIYGMNFRHMPELQWRFGYVWALGVMAAVTLGLSWYFNRKNWL
jgi:magnesium transporter